jgi:hypothetical protein
MAIWTLDCSCVRLKQRRITLTALAVKSKSPPLGGLPCSAHRCPGISCRGPHRSSRPGGSRRQFRDTLFSPGARKRPHRGNEASPERPAGQGKCDAAREAGGGGRYRVVRAINGQALVWSDDDHGDGTRQAMSSENLSLCRSASTLRELATIPSKVRAPRTLVCRSLGTQPI